MLNIFLQGCVCFSWLSQSITCYINKVESFYVKIEIPTAL